MLTRCPACETHFRVTAEQIKARSGRVRCGSCQQVFNALDTLIETPVRATAALTPEPPQASAVEAPVYIEADAAAEAEAPQDEVTPLPDAPVPQSMHDAAEDHADPVPEIPEPAEAVALEAAPMPEAEGPDWSETFPDPPPPPRRWPWVVGSLVALAALGLQAVLAFRVELAVLWPEAKPALIALCGAANCEVPLPAKITLIGIEASDLHPDPEHAGKLALTATLKNRAPFAQQLPHLEVTLTDTADKAIARRVLTPADYLPPATPFAAGMRPNADVTIAVGIDPGALTASGYRLYVFYP
jgi:predicted Zn finger-like uncharacterized protein